MGISTIAIIPALYAKVSYDALRDFTPISQVVKLPNVLIVHPSLPARSLKDLIALAKARPPGTISIRRGTSQKPRIGALVGFVNAMLHPNARISDADLAAVRSAGYNDAQIAETVQVIAQTVFTNLFNRVNQTALDFPAAPAL